MGNGSSSQQRLSFDTLNSTVTNVVTSKTDSSTVKIDNINSFTGDIVFGPSTDLDNCSFDFSQSIDSKLTLYKMTVFNSKVDLKTQLKTAVDATLATKNATEQGAFATALNVTNSKQSISSTVKNLIENNISDSTYAQFNAGVNNLNEKKGFLWNGKCKNSVIKLSQQIISEQFVSLLTDAITSTLNMTEIENGQKGGASSENKTKQQGAIDALAGLLQGPFLIIGLIIIVLAILAFVFRKTISKVAEKKSGVSFGKIERLINSVKKI
jgi:hypothetical protein